VAQPPSGFTAWRLLFAGLLLFEIAGVVVCLDYVASFIEYANHGIIALELVSAEH